MVSAGSVSKSLAVIGLLFSAAVYASGTHSYAYAGERMAVEASNDLKAVKPAEVCMVNGSVMGKPQIPVQFDGKTYYGCCEGCVEKLKNNRSLRYAKDPLTGKEVDKARAFITAELDGGALYFESAATAKKYLALREKKK